MNVYETIKGVILQKRKLTPAYIFFYILFSPDTWKILMGIIVAYFLAPVITSPDTGDGGKAMLYVMIAAIGYSVSGIPANRITAYFKKIILNKK